MPPTGLASWLTCFGSQPKTRTVKNPRHDLVAKEPPERAQIHGQVNSGSGHRAGPLTPAEPRKPKGSGVGVRPPAVGVPSGLVPLSTSCQEATAISAKSTRGEDRSDSYQGRGERSSAPTEPSAERGAALRAWADAAAAGAVPKLSEPGACASALVDAPAAKPEALAPATPLEEALAVAQLGEPGHQAAEPSQQDQPQRGVAQISLEIEPHDGAGGIHRLEALEIPPAAAEAEAEAAAAAAAVAMAATAGGEGLQRKQRSKRVAEDGGGPRGSDAGESIPHADALAAVLAAAERTDAWVATTLPAARQSAAGEHQQHQQHQPPPTSQRTSSKRLLSKRISSKRVSGDTGAPPPLPVLRTSASGRVDHNHNQPPQPPRVSASGALYATAPAAAASTAVPAPVGTHVGGGSASAAASRRALLSKGPSMRQDLLGMALTELHDILEAAPPAPAVGPSPAAAAPVAAATHGGNGRASETGGPASGSGVVASNDPRELSKAVLQVLQKMPSSRKMMDAAAAAPATAGHPVDPATVHKAHSSRAIASKAHSAKALLAATPSAREFVPQTTTSGGAGHATAGTEPAAAAEAASEAQAPAAATTSLMVASIEVVPEEEDEQAPDVPARPAPPPQKAATFRKTHSSARRQDGLARGASSRSHKDLMPSRHHGAAPRPQLDTANRGLLDGEDAAAGRTLVRVMKRFSEAGPEAAAQYVASGDATTSAATAPQIKDQAAQRCFREGMLLSAALRLNSQRHQQDQPQAQPQPKAASTRQR